MLKRPTNLSRADVQAKAQAAVSQHGGPEYARVFYKFDCAHCGYREIVNIPNVLPEDASCSVCGGVTKILAAGYALNVRRDPSVDWDGDGPKIVFRKPYESDRGDA